MFVDSAGIAGPVVHRLRDMGYYNVIEVNYGAWAPDDKYLNMRAYMWGECKEWLLQGGIPNDPKLAFDLGAPGYSHDRNVKLVLEKKEDIKKRLKRSPDDGDALALTFARKLPVPRKKTTPDPWRSRLEWAGEDAWMA
jgi:hypothetical protein